jgi:N-acetylglucosaminyldiphosphoundecaprenol N-acetyl-beta-D-mannosaminyltransferase
MLKLCDWGRQYNYRHFFYGGEPGVATRLAAQLASSFPGLRVAGTFSPPFRESVAEEEAETLDLINSSAPDVVWVGLGTPKQEKWMAMHLGSIQATAMIGVGAAFDFHSGKVQWSPPWIRKLGLEWAWRTALEPARMWRRDLDNFNFLVKVARQSLGTNPSRATLASGNETVGR